MTQDEDLGRCAVQKKLPGNHSLILQTIRPLLADRAIDLYKRCRYLGQGLFSQFLFYKWFKRYRKKLFRAEIIHPCLGHVADLFRGVVF